MANEREAEMKPAVEKRRRAKRAFQKARCASAVPKFVQPKAAASLASRHTPDDWEKFRPLQAALLDAELDVLRLAVCGVPILDFDDRCKNPKKNMFRDDIAFEIEQLFACVASKPTQRVREFLNKPTISGRKRDWARRTIMQILRTPLTAFFQMADMLAAALLDCIDKQCPDQRIRLGLVRVLMFISDCFRYSFDHQKSKDAAQLMHVVSPRDPEAHMRLGMNLAMLCDESEAIRPFFHYCVFLANRKVPIDHSEAVVVKHFVRNMALSRSRRSESEEEKSTKNFYCVVINALWSILSDDLQLASEKVHQRYLWDSLSHFIEEGVAEPDMLDLIGAVIFTHYRTSPKGSSGGSLLPQRELCDFFVGEIILGFCRNMTKQLQTLHGSLRSRKKNRRRAMQKKRRADGAAVQTDVSTSIGYEIFKTMVHLDHTVPTLGAISFLTHYWSKARSAPAPSADLKPLGRTLKALQGLIEDLEKIEEMTCIISLVSHIDSKMITDTRGLIPAMPEDLKFCTFVPCQAHDMFHHTSLQQVPLPSFLKQNDEGMVRPALKAIANESYESLVAATSRRHLEAFSQQSVKEVIGRVEPLDKESACEIVAFTIRKFRIRRLIRDLSKVAGGKLTRMSFQSSCDSRRNSRDGQLSADLPQPGQPRASVAESDSLHEPISARELGAQLKKRRRLIGNCTVPVADASHSNGSSDERRNDGERAGHTEVGTRTKQNIDSRSSRQTEALRGNVRRSPRPVSRGSILSQGSLQLSYAPRPDEVKRNAVKPKQRPSKNHRSRDLSLILTSVLYALDSDTAASPTEGPLPWRRAPTDEFVQTLFQSQPFPPE